MVNSLPVMSDADETVVAAYDRLAQLMLQRRAREQRISVSNGRVDHTPKGHIDRLASLFKQQHGKCPLV